MNDNLRLHYLIRATLADAEPLAEKILIDEMPIIPLYTYVRSYQLSPDFKGYNPHILDHHHPKFIYLERD